MANLVSMSVPIKKEDDLNSIKIDFPILSKKATSQFDLPDYLYQKDGKLYHTKTNLRVIRAIGSAEILDKHGEVVDIDAIIKIMPSMMKMGGVMLYNHMNLVTGKIIHWDKAQVLDKSSNVEYKAVWIDIELFDEYPFHKEIERKIDLPDGHEEKINGVSIGGRKLKKQRTCNDEICYNRITEIEGHEYSLVEKMANQIALIIAKNTESGKMSENQEVIPPNTLDQSKVTFPIPSEEDLNKMEPKKDAPKKDDPKDKPKKDKKELKEMDEDEDKDKDKDKDEYEEEDKDKEMKKFMSGILDTLACMQKRIEGLEKSEAPPQEVKVPSTITHKGETYVLKKSIKSEFKELNEELENLKKGGKPTNQDLNLQNPVEGKPKTELELEATRLEKMSVTDRINYAHVNHKERLEKMGIFTQN